MGCRYRCLWNSYLIVSPLQTWMGRIACLYAKTSRTGIVLLALMYTTSLVNSKRFVSFDLIAPSSRGERSTHSTPSWNEIRIVQLKLSHVDTWEVSQKQHCPPRSLLTKRQRAGALKSAYWKTTARSYFDSIACNGGCVLRKVIGIRYDKRTSPEVMSGLLSAAAALERLCPSCRPRLPWQGGTGKSVTELEVFDRFGCQRDPVRGGWWGPCCTI